MTKAGPVVSHTEPSIAAVKVVVKQRKIEIAIEDPVEVLIHNHFQVVVGRKSRTCRLPVLIQSPEEDGQAISMADVPARSGVYLLLRGHRKLLAGHAAVFVVGMGGIVTVEIAGAANTPAFEVFGLRIISSLALKEADTRVDRGAKHGDLIRAERRQGGVVGMRSQDFRR